MIQRILCPVNFIDNSKRGMAYALSIAKENNAQLIFFHVAAFPDTVLCRDEAQGFYPGEARLAKFKVDRILAQAELTLTNFVRATLPVENSGTAWKTRVGLGKVSDEIIVAAVGEEVDLIVLARSEKTPLARLFTRSISEAVSKSAPCPVLIMDTTDDRRRTGAWRVPALREILEGSS